MKFNGFVWVDLTDPSSEDLTSLAAQAGLPEDILLSSLDKRHLPKCDELEDGFFLVLRVRNHEANAEHASIYELTRKISMFLKKDHYLVTIHRASLPIIDALWNKAEKNRATFASPNILFAEVCRSAMLSYDDLLEHIEEELESLEPIIFSDEFSYELHRVRGRLSAIKRLLWHTKTTLQRLPHSGKQENTLFNELLERITHLIYFSDELYDDATSLLNLQISLSSQRTNEVIRVLTIFSVFFMPLTFIVGVYGMNFRYMPELNWLYGYPAAICLMAAIVGVIALWFKKKGWLKF